MTYGDVASSPGLRGWRTIMFRLSSLYCSIAAQANTTKAGWSQQLPKLSSKVNSTSLKKPVRVCLCRYILICIYMEIEI